MDCHFHFLLALSECIYGFREKIVTWFSLIDINNLYEEIKTKEKGSQEADFADRNDTLMSMILQCVSLLLARWLF